MDTHVKERHLQKAIEALEYELTMLEFTFRELSSMPEDERSTDPGRALMESFLLHYRVIVGFLYPDKSPPKRDDDLEIFGFDYSPTWMYTYDEFAKTLPAEKPRERLALNRYLAHLSAGRAYRVWQLGDMYTRIQSAIAEFRSSLPDTWKYNIRETEPLPPADRGTSLSDAVRPTATSFAQDTIRVVFNDGQIDTADGIGNP
jgi:hypothetical protein